MNREKLIQNKSSDLLWIIFESREVFFLIKKSNVHLLHLAEKYYFRKQKSITKNIIDWLNNYHSVIIIIIIHVRVADESAATSHKEVKRREAG